MKLGLLPISAIVSVAVIAAVLASYFASIPEEGLPESEVSQLTGEIKIGSILPLTGDLASHGGHNLAATKLGVDDFNSHLESLNAPWSLKLVSEDSATSPVVALEKLTSLYAKNIDIVIGPETSSNIRNMKGYADSNNILLVSCCSTAPALAIPGDNVFRMTTNDQHQANVLTKLANQYGIEVIVPVYRGDTWGDGLVEATAEHFAELGRTVDDGVRYNPESPEFSATASLLADKVADAKQRYGDDKVAVMLISFSEGLLFMQSAASHDVLGTVQWFGSDGNALDQTITSDKIGKSFTTATDFTSVLVSASDSEINQRVKSTLTGILGNTPITYAYGSYDAVWLVGLAMLETQSTDVDAVKNTLHTVARNHNGAIGNTALNEAGDLAQADYEIHGVVDGDWVLLGKYTSNDDVISMVDQ